jgi:hypothetical protein
VIAEEYVVAVRLESNTAATLERVDGTVVGGAGSEITMVVVTIRLAIMASARIIRFPVAVARRLERNVELLPYCDCRMCSAHYRKGAA